MNIEKQLIPMDWLDDDVPMGDYVYVIIGSLTPFTAYRQEFTRGYSYESMSI